MKLVKSISLVVIISFTYLNIINLTPVISTDIESVDVTYLNRIGTGGDSFDVQVIDDIAYVTCGYVGLKIFNISIPQNLIELGSLKEINLGSNTGYAHQFSIDFPFMYIGDGRGGLNIVNVSDPMHPSNVYHELGIYSWDVNILKRSGQKFAFVANGFQSQGASLAIFNVTNSSNIFLINQINTIGDITDLQIDQSTNNVYLMDVNAGLTVVNISSFENLEILSKTPLNRYTGSIAIMNELIFTVNYLGGLKIFNVSDPANVTLIHEYSDKVKSGWDIKIDPVRKLAFITDEDLGLKIFDIQNPLNPTFLQEYADDSIRYNNVFVKGNRIYLNTNNGLTILDLQIKNKSLVMSETTTTSKSVKEVGLYNVLLCFMSFYLIKRRFKSHRN